MSTAACVIFVGRDYIYPAGIIDLDLGVCLGGDILDDLAAWPMSRGSSPD
jgi:hypothetical protein